MRCSLVMIGTELLNGATLDTNSIYIAKELNKIGIKIDYKFIVGDDISKIIEILEFGRDKNNLIIISGGLGPTDDDLTKQAISRFLDKKLIVENNEANLVRNKFKAKGIQFLNKNYKEVEKPEGAVSFNNDVGMAPAFYIDGIVAFPGVPSELQNMLPKFLKYYMKISNQEISPIYIKDIVVTGIAESILEEKIKKYFVSSDIEYEFLVKDYGVVVRLQTTVNNKNIVEKIREKIYNSIGKYILGEDCEDIERKVLNILKLKKYNFSVAESCTGGMLSSKIVSISGASEVFKEGVVTYSISSKCERLNINRLLIDKFGAVSSRIAKEMVKGLQTDVAISITGVAGPTQGENDKPIGTVYIGIKVKNRVECFKFNLEGNRLNIRKKAVLHSLLELYKILEEDR